MNWPRDLFRACKTCQDAGDGDFPRFKRMRAMRGGLDIRSQGSDTDADRSVRRRNRETEDWCLPGHRAAFARDTAVSAAGKRTAFEQVTVPMAGRVRILLPDGA